MALAVLRSQQPHVFSKERRKSPTTQSLIAFLALVLASASATADDVALPAPKYVAEWGAQGSGAGAFQYIDGIACGPESLIYVCDWGNARVQVFRPDGTLTRVIVPGFSSAGNELHPYDVTVDRGDTLYVLSNGDVIQKLGPSGNVIGEWTTDHNDPPGQIPGLYIEGVKASPNYVYATSSRLSGDPPHGNGGIVQLSKDGGVLLEIPVWESSDEGRGRPDLHREVDGGAMTPCRSPLPHPITRRASRPGA